MQMEIKGTPPPSGKSLGIVVFALGARGSCLLFPGRAGGSPGAGLCPRGQSQFAQLTQQFPSWERGGRGALTAPSLPIPFPSPSSHPRHGFKGAQPVPGLCLSQGLVAAAVAVAAEETPLGASCREQLENPIFIRHFSKKQLWSERRHKVPAGPRER